MKKKTVEELVAERGKTHGDYADHARCTQNLKRVIESELEHRNFRGQPSLSDTQLEALDMFCHKIGRIIAGDPNIHDHWDDIGGYAKITSERI